MMKSKAEVKTSESGTEVCVCEVILCVSLCLCSLQYMYATVYINAEDKCALDAGDERHFLIKTSMEGASSIMQKSLAQLQQRPTLKTLYACVHVCVGSPAFVSERASSE